MGNWLLFYLYQVHVQEGSQQAHMHDHIFFVRNKWVQQMVMGKSEAVPRDVSIWRQLTVR